MSVSAYGYQITRHEASSIVFWLKRFMRSLLVNRRARVMARRNGLYRCLLHAIGKRMLYRPGPEVLKLLINLKCQQLVSEIFTLMNRILTYFGNLNLKVLLVLVICIFMSSFNLKLSRDENVKGLIFSGPEYRCLNKILPCGIGLNIRYATRVQISDGNNVLRTGVALHKPLP